MENSNKRCKPREACVDMRLGCCNREPGLYIAVLKVELKMTAYREVGLFNREAPIPDIHMPALLRLLHLYFCETSTPPKLGCFSYKYTELEA
eukprot:977430-Pyramimonas_sp.AAC.2